MPGNIYAGGSNEPKSGELIKADTIKALMKRLRDPNVDNLPRVDDDYIYLPLIIADEDLKVRHRLLKLTSYDDELEAWSASVPDNDDIDSTESTRSVYVVYQADDYGILIGEKPVRVNTSPVIVSQGKEIRPGDNVGGDSNQYLSLDRFGLLAVTQNIQDSIAPNDYYCLVVRGCFDSRMVHCHFIEFYEDDPTIALAVIISSSVSGLVEQQILIKDVDGKGFEDETEDALSGRLLGAVWMQYVEDGYTFWRWELWKISCP